MTIKDDAYFRVWSVLHTLGLSNKSNTASKHGTSESIFYFSSTHFVKENKKGSSMWRQTGERRCNGSNSICEVRIERVRNDGWKGDETERHGRIRPEECTWNPAIAALWRLATDVCSLRRYPYQPTQLDQIKGVHLFTEYNLLNIISWVCIGIPMFIIEYFLTAIIGIIEPIWLLERRQLIHILY